MVVGVAVVVLGLWVAVMFLTGMLGGDGDAEAGKTTVSPTSTLEPTTKATEQPTNGSTGNATKDTGPIEPWPMDDTFFEAELTTQPEPGEGWLSAPWALARPIEPDGTELMMVFVAGDSVCSTSAGFTLVETDQSVTVGAYTIDLDPAEGDSQTECPDEPVSSWSYGTIVLSEPLGDRELMHEGLDDRYAGYVWPKVN